MDGAAIAVEIAERAAILVVENEVLPAEAEHQALGEALDGLLAQRPPGIIGELVVTDQLRRQLEVELDGMGLVGRRAPAWGFASIVAEGRTYRPAAAGELGSWAIIVPATDDGALVDLVAQDLATGRLRTRLDVTAIVGADEIEAARDTGRPVLAFPDLVSWLRGSCRGVVIADWRRADRALDGVAAILTSRRLVEPLARATRACRPRPVIAAPSPGVADVAA